MPNYTVNLNQLTPNTTVLVRGVLAYGRLTTKIDGEELKKDMSRRQQKGWIAIEKPYTTATINNAQVIYASGTPQQKTPAEVYVEEHFYQSRAQQATGWSYTANNKGRNLPYICEQKGNQAIQVIPEGELANGLDVTMVLRTFKGRPNNGLSLDGIIVNEPIRYYKGEGAGLADRGITFVPVPETANNEQASTAPAAAPTQTPVQESNQANTNQFGNASAQGYAPNSNPFATNNAPGMPFGVPQTNYQQAPNGNQPGGIRYDPSQDRKY